MDTALPTDQGKTRSGHAYIRIGNAGTPLCIIDDLHIRPGPVEGLTLQGMIQAYEEYLKHHQVIYLFRQEVPEAERQDEGEAAAAVREVTIGSEAEGYLNALFDFGHPEVHLLGNSFGGMIVLEMAAAAPQLFTSAIVANAAYRVAAPMREELHRFAALTRAEEWRRLHAAVAGSLHAHSRLRPLFEAIGWSAPQLLGIPENPERVARLFEAYAEADLSDRLPRADLPVLLVAGGRDPYLSKELLETTVDGLPRGELALWQGAGHSLLRSRPEQVERRVLPFMAEAEG